jgi:hypothetical protein
LGPKIETSARDVLAAPTPSEAKERRFAANRERNPASLARV